MSTVVGVLMVGVCDLSSL